MPCGGGAVCADGESCCKTAAGGWACCPVVNATCCPDHVRRCDVRLVGGPFCARCVASVALIVLFMVCVCFLRLRACGPVGG